ncbi:MAG: vitamin K epoxide reductase [Actinobacteria bacterium]|nr:MAG: vitamin K epoxide reductase [Actinomycetota bacterium]
MIISGIASLYASLVLSVEAWQLASDSAANFGCDVNEVISCSTVAQSPQAQVLGFPNAFLGILFSTVILAISIALLGNVRFPRWYMLGAQAFYTVGLFFALWLFIQSFFVIHVLCPWCLLVFATIVLTWVALARLNTRDGTMPLPRWCHSVISQGLDWVIVGLFFFVVAAAIVARYGIDLVS